MIDVPGHEKFLPNMVAGVCGMDLVLLTIAMDEGIMPQTREHVNILDALQVPAGIVVLTKYDMVEPEEAAGMEVKVLILMVQPMMIAPAAEDQGMFIPVLPLLITLLDVC